MQESGRGQSVPMCVSLSPSTPKTINGYSISLIVPV